jgi:hypothetical protein
VRGSIDIQEWRPEWRQEATPGGNWRLEGLDSIDGGIAGITTGYGQVGGQAVDGTAWSSLVGVQAFDGTAWRFLVPPMQKVEQTTSDGGEYRLPDRSVGVEQGCFHRGRFWWVEFHKARAHTYTGFWHQLDSIEIADTIRIHSVGIEGDETVEAMRVADTSVNAASLIPQGDSLALLMLHWGDGTHTVQGEPIRARWVKLPSGRWVESSLAAAWVRGARSGEYGSGFDYDSRVQAGGMPVLIRREGLTARFLRSSGEAMAAITLALDGSQFYSDGFVGMARRWTDAGSRVTYPVLDSLTFAETWVWAAPGSLGRPHRFMPPGNRDTYHFGAVRWRGRLWWAYYDNAHKLSSTPLP